jgi:hypothetical protein
VKRLVFAAFAVAITLWALFALHQIASAAQLPTGNSSISVEAFIWRFNEDYPGSKSDADTRVNTVYVKTHDGTDWESRFDKNPNAISGTGALQATVQRYNSMGVHVIPWFVPKGTNYRAQLDMAEAVIDSGTGELYADVEPWAGFCDKECANLAENFWKPLRAERPNARLGVVYDPRPRHAGPSGLTSWLSVANVALPMCYWNDFTKAPWNTPDGCIAQAHADLATYAPGNTGLEYVPILQGSTSPGEMKTAMSTIRSLGGHRMSIWRRGVVPAEVWDAIAQSRLDPAKPLHNLVVALGGRADPNTMPKFSVRYIIVQMLDRYLGMIPPA